MESTPACRKRELANEEKGDELFINLDEDVKDWGVATLASKDRLMQVLEEVQRVNERAISICKVRKSLRGVALEA